MHKEKHNKQVQLSRPQLNLTSVQKSIKTKIQSIDVYMPYQPYDTQITYMEYVIKCLNNKETGVIQSPTGTGKTLSLLASTLSWQYHNSAKFNQHVPQIYYTSRTHQQLKQAISELKKLPFIIKSAILSSRQQSCINLQLKQLNGKDKGFQCRKRITHQQGKSCSFYKPQKYYQDLNYYGKVMDLQQVVLRGKCQKYCPYFYNKNLTSKAHIIFMPYNYLFQSTQVQEQNGIQLMNSILIIDQAHNIQQALQQSKEYTLTLNILSRALNQISQLHQQKLRQLKSQKIINQYSDDIEDMDMKWKKTIKSSLQAIQYHASYVTLIHEYFQMINIEAGGEGMTFNTKQFIQLIEKATDHGQFGVITKKLPFIVKQLKSLRDDLKFRPYWALQNWSKFVQKIWQLSQIYLNDKQSSKYKVQILYEGSDIKCNIYCLDPSTGMKEILNNQLHSVILTSGTLSPIKAFTRELKLENIEAVSCPHIIEPEQARTFIVTQGPNMKLNFSYQNRSNPKMYQQLGLVITEIIRNTPNGVVVFFPSYQLLDQTVRNLNSSKLLSKIYQQKSLHIQSKQNTQFVSTLQRYLKDAQSPKGAVLFALIRGKISEGLDFADDKCRAVIVVGVPYPARKDIKVVSKMQYLNELSNKQKKDVLSGQQWYLSEAIRSINQGIGRIIRHKKDYGNIYLLDQRYQKSNPDLKGQLSSWARASLTIITKYYDLADQFKRNKQSTIIPPPKNQYFNHFKTTAFGSIKSTSGQFKKSDTSTVQNNQNNDSSKLMSLKSMISQMKKQKQIKQSSIPSTEIKLQKIQCQKQKSSKTNQNLTSNTNIDKNDQILISRQKQIFGKTKITLKRQEKIIPIDQLEQCPICRLTKKLITNIACSHKICQDCWKIWLKKDLRCPICRIRIRQKFLLVDE